jgi:hypothetical protein
MDHLVEGPAAPRQAVVKQQVRERFSPQGDLHQLDLGEITEADLAGLIGQRVHHLRRRAMQRLPLLHPPLQRAFHLTPVVIWLLSMQMLPQRGWREGRVTFKQGEKHWLPHRRQ